MIRWWMLLPILIVMIVMIVMMRISSPTFPTFPISSSSSSTFPISSSTHLHFLSPNETWEMIANHHTFYQTFFDRDWEQRGVKDYDQYMRLLQSAGTCQVYLTHAQKHFLSRACEAADRIFEQIHLPYLDGPTAANLPWKIGLFKGREYEFGYPHTIHDVILLPLHACETDDFHRLCELMIHEKTHVYQKCFPEQTDRYLQWFGFERVQPRTLETTNIRPNPDTDNWIYRHLHTGRWYVMSEAYSIPPSERDHNSQFYEHPFERMAIEIARTLPINSSKQSA